MDTHNSRGVTNALPTSRVGMENEISDFYGSINSIKIIEILQKKLLLTQSPIGPPPDVIENKQSKDLTIKSFETFTRRANVILPTLKITNTATGVALYETIRACPHVGASETAGRLRPRVRARRNNNIRYPKASGSNV
ncbi:hypothetical protein EVAR_94383_1 [Eumeta japonica]|uniref:Uncharacterized protein n=1 Tax=Eumeta variegata TaxID=151549 RepID=A0A4C1TPY8_EUMVA|nr:hypothetical protein EVAR_94383_1 [Eumeta japonica]